MAAIIIQKNLRVQLFLIYNICIGMIVKSGLEVKDAF